jgi:hypothetical protein
MDAILKLLVDAPLGTLFVMAGLAFLFIAVAGNVAGKIEPGRMGRIAAAVVGPVLLVAGLALHRQPVSSPSGGDPTAPATAAPRRAVGDPTAPATVVPVGPQPGGQPMRVHSFAEGDQARWRDADLVLLGVQPEGEHVVAARFALRNRGQGTVEFYRIRSEASLQAADGVRYGARPWGDVTAEPGVRREFAIAFDAPAVPGAAYRLFLTTLAYVQPGGSVRLTWEPVGLTVP